MRYKNCNFCGTEFKRDQRLSDIQWSKALYCSRKCFSSTRRFSLKTWAEAFHKNYVRGNNDECWEWTGSRCEKGYGMFHKLHGGTIRAHRVAYDLHYLEEIPSELQACHHCDNPSCVNPYHLFKGTNKENVDDKIKKGRCNPVYGEKVGTSKLNIDAVHSIQLSKLPTKVLCSIFGVSGTTIRNVRYGRTWNMYSLNDA